MGIDFTITTDCAGPNNTGRILVSARTGASAYRTYQPQTSESAAQNVTTNFYSTNGFIVFDTGDGITTGTWYVKVADNSDPSIYLVKSVVVNCTTTTTTQARPAKSSYIFFNRGFGLSECCGEDNNGDRFAFSSGPPAPLLPGQTSTTTTTSTSTSTSTTSTTTQGPPPEPFFPILDLVKKEQTRRRFIARLRLNGPTGPIVANSKVITVTNMPSNTLLPTVFTNSLLSDQISTRFNSAYHQKTINTLTIAGSRIDTRTVDYCYDDRVFVYVTGRATGNVWGGGNYYGTVTPYSEDSDIHTAAVHAGIVQVNQTALVKRHQIDYYKEETRPSFFGDYKNGVMSKTRLEGCGYTFDITNVPPIVILPHLFYFFKQTFTATANQTIFTVTRPGDYILQQCLVFQNGILLDTSEYTDTSTSTVTLTTGATLGHNITVVSFKSTNSVPQVQPSFTRYSVNLNQNFEYAPSGFSVTPGVDLVFLNGVIFPNSDYVLINGRITFQLPVTGTLTIIVWSLDDKSQPNGNPLNIAINTVIGQTTYNTTFDPLAFNLYNNGVLLVDANDYTVGVNSYTLASTPTSTLNTLLQQSFTRTGI